MMFIDNLDEHTRKAMKQRDKDRSHFLKHFQNLILQYDHIVLFHHIKPDGDCLGGVFGLKELIKHNFPNKRVYVVGSNPDNLFSWLTMKFDNNINYDFDFSKAMAIIVDVSNGARINFFDKFFKTSRFLFGAVVKIDHHDCPSDFHVDLSWDDPTYVAACGLIVQLSEFYGWKMTPLAATFLYLGIYTDSMGLSILSMLPRTLILAAKTWRAGADYIQIHENLTKRSLNYIHLSNYMMQKAIFTKNIAYGIFNQEEANKFNMKSFDSMVSVYGNIEGLWIWMLFVKKSGGTVDVSMRSINVSVRDIAVKYGGGGHDFAAGCSLENDDHVKDIINDAEKSVELAKQKINRERLVLASDPTSDDFARMNTSVIHKNPKLMEEAERLIEESKKDREEALAQAKNIKEE